MWRGDDAHRFSVFFTIVTDKMSFQFDDILELKDTSAGTKYFDKVTRVTGQCENSEVEVVLDINTDLYPVAVGDKFSFCLAKSITTSDNSEIPAYKQQNTLADRFDYVMYGKVYQMDMVKGQSTVIISVSFGGLLLKMKGEAQRLSYINLDDRIYMLMKRII